MLYGPASKEMAKYQNRNFTIGMGTTMGMESTIGMGSTMVMGSTMGMAFAKASTKSRNAKGSNARKCEPDLISSEGKEEKKCSLLDRCLRLR